MSAQLPSGERAIGRNGSLDTSAVAALRWPLPPGDVRLENGQAHIWCASMSAFQGQASSLRALLAPPERERAERFHFSRDRDNYVTRHAILRIILGNYLNTDPAEIHFRHGPSGKPEVGASPASFYFNDSRSADLALYAVTLACPVGVDIEQIRPIPDFEDIAARYFSRREAALIRALSPDKRVEAFYAAWTRKEAFLKATGEGIGENLPNVEVTLTPEDAAYLNVPGTPGAAGWRLRSFSPAAGYLGALAFRGEISSFREWTVSPSFISSTYY